jgi:hypothetical protein
MLTDKVEKAVKQFLDDVVPLHGIAETLSDLGISIGVPQLDNRLLDKINPKYHNIINEILEHALIEKDYDTAANKLSVLLAEAVDTPIIDGTPEEQQTYLTALQLIKAVIISLLAKKKAA